MNEQHNPHVCDGIGHPAEKNIWEWSFSDFFDGGIFGGFISLENIRVGIFEDTH